MPATTRKKGVEEQASAAVAILHMHMQHAPLPSKDGNMEESDDEEQDDDDDEEEDEGGGGGDNEEKKCCRETEALVWLLRW